MQGYGNQSRRSRYSIAKQLMILAGIGLLVAGSLVVGAHLAGSAAADSATVDEFHVANATHDLDAGGDLSDVTLDATLTVDHDVPDADRRLTKLAVGTNTSNVETIAFDNERSPGPAATTTLELRGSLFESQHFERSDFQPGINESVSHEIVVGAGIEVERETGDKVIEWTYETVTVTVTDGTTLAVTVGGSVTFEFDE